MSRSPELGAALFNTEANWAEVSTTFANRVQTIGNIDPSKLKREKLVPKYTTQLLNEIQPGVNGVYSGEFDVTMMLTGHGSTTAGVITLSNLETLLGIFLGAVVAARTAGGTTATAAGTVTALNVAAVNGYLAGALIGPIGSIGDGRGGGQFSVVGAHGTSVINLLVAIDAALNNTDVIRNPSVSYTIEDPVANPAITSTRWRFLTGNLQYDCRGCYPKKIVISGLEPGGEPMVRFTFGVSWWQEVAVTMPTATAVTVAAHAPVANGSFFLAAYGTTTRDATTKLNARSFSITWDLGMVERKGHGGVNPGQVVIGCSRVRSTGSVDVVLDAPDATAAPDLVSKWISNSPLHMAYVWGAADGQGGALYSPYVVPDGDSPTQFDNGGINSLRFKGRLGSDRTKTTDLERSALRLAQG